MTAIFISYRQNDAGPAALLIHGELAKAFGAEHVLLNPETLPTSSRREDVRQALEHCKVVLVVMGQRWLSMTAGGTRPSDNPDDPHLQDIAFALGRKDVTVIPVRTNGVSMLYRDRLPADIRSLADQSSRTISDNNAERIVDMKILVADIERLTGLVAKLHGPASSSQTRNAHREPALYRVSKRAFIVAAIVSIVLLIIAEVGLGWSLDAQEKSFVILIALLVTVGGTWLQHRLSGEKHDDT